MMIQRTAIALTLINSVFLTFLLGQCRKVEGQNIVPMLRGRGLEIVDGQGRVRASITVEPPVTIDSRTYPETVLLRLSDPKSGPVVKIIATEEGSSIGLSDDVDGGIEVSSTKRKGNFLKIVSRYGKVQTLKP